MSSTTSSRAHRRGLAVVVGLIAAVLVAAVTAVVLFDRSVSRVEVAGLASSERQPVSPQPTSTEPAPLQAPTAEPEPAEPDEPTVAPLTVLVAGSDSREVLTAEERERFNTGSFDGERTEVVALVRLDPAADTIRMVNIPRDTVVTRCDGSRGRINAAHGIGERDGIGGMSCLVQTITAWSGLSIDHAVKVDFRGFVDIVDAVGGVEMTFDAPLRDRRANLDVPEGTVRLDGRQALAFVRARGMDDDFGRIARQQRFVRELQSQIAALGVVEDLPALLRLADAGARAVELDATLTLNRIRALVTDHRATLRREIETQTVPGRVAEDSVAYLLQPDEERAALLFSWLELGPRHVELPDEPVVPWHAEPPAGSAPPEPADGPRREDPSSALGGPAAS